VNAFTGDGLSEEQAAAQDYVKLLLAWRKTAKAVHEGKLMQFTPAGNVYVYFRYDDTDTVMVAFNRGDEAVDLGLDRFAERIGTKQSATDVIGGTRYSLTRPLPLKPGSVLVLELE
jgi:glycosidase